MAKKGKRSVPVAQPKSDPNKIVIRQEDLPKERGAPIPVGRPCDNRRNRVRELHRGNRRHGKHRKDLRRDTSD